MFQASWPIIVFILINNDVGGWYSSISLFFVYTTGLGQLESVVGVDSPPVGPSLQRLIHNFLVQVTHVL